MECWKNWKQFSFCINRYTLFKLKLGHNFTFENESDSQHLHVEYTNFKVAIQIHLLKKSLAWNKSNADLTSWVPRMNLMALMLWSSITYLWRSDPPWPLSLNTESLKLLSLFCMNNYASSSCLPNPPLVPIYYLCTTLFCLLIWNCI